MVAALVVGAPRLWHGWRLLPGAVRVAAAGVVAAYLISLVLGDEISLTAAARGGGHRDLLFLSDLIVGVGAMCLVVALWEGRSLRPLLLALAAGALVAATYGLYQWLGFHFGWPGTHPNNASDYAGPTAADSQGAGLLGWQRPRGTFSEPHFLASYLASLLPLVAIALLATKRWLAIPVLLVVAVGLIVPASLPAWATVLVGFAFVAAVATVVRGRPLQAWAASATLSVAVVMSLLVLVSPASAGSLVGRSSTELTITTDFRKTFWDSAVASWSARPVIGYGPGQSSVRLAYQVHDHPSTLASAQGLWAASLIDAGVLGFAAWLFLFGAVAAAGVRLVARRADGVSLAIFGATVIGILGAEIAGDRLELRVWLVIGVLLAACRQASAEQGDERHEQPRRSADRA